jgi:altronate dehydratase small subunit
MAEDRQMEKVEAPSNRSYDAMRLHGSDQVATVIADLEAGDSARTIDPSGEEKVIAIVEPIPFGHKFASSRIAAGEHILKYGESIGVAAVDISVGQHVHTHNVESQRGRGDLA